MQTTRTDNGLLHRTGQAAQCIRGKGHTAATCPPEPAPNGFLRQPLLPLYECSDIGLPPKEQAEQQFVLSFMDFTAQQGLPLKGYMDMPYPYNILLTYQQTVKAMKWHRPDSEMAIISTERGSIALAEKEQYYTNNTLFYIPVCPLYKGLEANAENKGLLVILSVFAYLYTVVAVPYYRDSGTFLYWQYEMVREWIESDPDSYEQEDYLQRLAELRRADDQGDAIDRMLNDPRNLSQLENRVTAFTPSTDWDRQAHQIGKRALQLYSDFPTATLYDHVSDDGYASDYVAIGDYVSFIHDLDGSLFDEIFQTVNEDFGNRAAVQEPTVLHLYGTGQTARKNTGFEQQLFPLIDDLVTLLMRL